MMASILCALKKFYQKKYLQNLMHAYYFTKNAWGTSLDLSDIDIPPKQYNDKTMIDVMSIIMNYLEPKEIKNIAFNCKAVSIDIHNLLKKEYDIDSIVTSGYLKINGRKRFYNTTRTIISQYGNNGNKLGHHVWLTISGYIIDPTLMVSIYAINPNYFSRKTIEQNAVIFYLCMHNKIKIENDVYEHIPQFLGKQFYDHTNYDCRRENIVPWDRYNTL